MVSKVVSALLEKKLDDHPNMLSGDMPIPLAGEFRP
jgi:hypothetical protein